MMQNKQHSPFHTLIFMLCILATCTAIIVFFPAGGIRISNSFTLKFPDRSFFDADSSTTNEQEVKHLIDLYENMTDSLANADTTAVDTTLSEGLQHIKMNLPAGTHPLRNFFTVLDKLKNKEIEKTRILHFGDSQIEGDRITGYIREQLQKQYGGYGPGLLPAFEVVPSAAIDQTNEGNWKRYALFGSQNSGVNHDRFGILANFGRFTAANFDSSVTSTSEGVIRLRPSDMAFSRSRSYSRLRMWFGYNRDSLNLQISSGDSVIALEKFGPSGYLSREYNLGFTSSAVDIRFSGKDSPEVYALSLESNSGIYVDNIAMRGGSGTVFKKINRYLLQQQLQSLEVSLIILQFGGNSVPHITSTKEAERYGSWFASQIQTLKSMVPGASFLVIGPSDMAYKEGQDFVTYPYLTDVRDALRNAALSEGCAFWDLYELMGGKNSMKTWVNADPPLAAPDYIHFSPKGARTVAELLMKSIEKEYKNCAK
jgi:lysophospholipase L1-like esterase